MSWLRIDDSFDHHPKILALGSDQRRWTWCRVLIYTCRYRSAKIPQQIIESVPRATPQFLRECVELGLVDATDDGLLVHDWDSYNGSDARVLSRERQRNHRDKSVTGSVTETVTKPLPSVTETVTKPLPERDSRVGAPARPVPSQEELRSLSGASSSSDGGGSAEAAPPSTRPDPSKVFACCGEKLGYGHADGCASNPATLPALELPAVPDPATAHSGSSALASPPTRIAAVRPC